MSEGKLFIGSYALCGLLEFTDKVKEMHEEWTFTKSALNSSPEWHLTNIDRPQ